jgi:hypothetical protein
MALRPSSVVANLPCFSASTTRPAAVGSSEIDRQVIQGRIQRTHCVHETAPCLPRAVHIRDLLQRLLATDLLPLRDLLDAESQPTIADPTN